MHHSYILVHVVAGSKNILPYLPPHEALFERTLHVMCNDHIRSVHYVGLSSSGQIEISTGLLRCSNPGF